MAAESALLSALSLSLPRPRSLPLLPLLFRAPAAARTPATAGLEYRERDARLVGGGLIAAAAVAGNAALMACDTLADLDFSFWRVSGGPGNEIYLRRLANVSLRADVDSKAYHDLRLIERICPARTRDSHLVCFSCRGARRARPLSVSQDWRFGLFGGGSTKSRRRDGKLAGALWGAPAKRLGGQHLDSYRAAQKVFRARVAAANPAAQG